jgi:hypothetical protein
MKQSLVSLTINTLDLEKRLFESGGEITPEIEQELEITENNLSEKVDNYKLLIDHLDHRVNYFKDVKAQVNSAQNILKNTVERLKSNLKFACEKLKTDELCGDLYRFKLSKPKSKVVIEDKAEIPLSFMNEVVSFEPNLERIQEALERGEVITGCRLEESQSLRSYMNAKK